MGLLRHWVEWPLQDPGTGRLPTSGGSNLPAWSRLKEYIDS